MKSVVFQSLLLICPYHASFSSPQSSFASQSRYSCLDKMGLKCSSVVLLNALRFEALAWATAILNSAFEYAVPPASSTFCVHVHKVSIALLDLYIFLVDFVAFRALHTFVQEEFMFDLISEWVDNCDRIRVSHHHKVDLLTLPHYFVSVEYITRFPHLWVYDLLTNGIRKFQLVHAHLLLKSVKVYQVVGFLHWA